MRGILLFLCFGSVAYAKATEETEHLEETSPLAYLRRDDPFFERAAAEFGYYGGPWTINRLSDFRPVSQLDTHTYASSHRHHHVLYCPRMRNHTLIYPSTTIGFGFKCNTGQANTSTGYEYNNNATTCYRGSDTYASYSNAPNIDNDNVIKRSGLNASTDHITDIDTLKAKKQRHDTKKTSFGFNEGDQLHLAAVPTKSSNAYNDTGKDIDSNSNTESATFFNMSGAINDAIDINYGPDIQTGSQAGIKAESDNGIKIGSIYHDELANYTTDYLGPDAISATGHKLETEAISHITNNADRNTANEHYSPPDSVPLLDIVTEIGQEAGCVQENTPTFWETGSDVKASSGTGENNLSTVPSLPPGLTGSDPGSVLKYCEENIDFLQKICCNNSSM